MFYGDEGKDAVCIAMYEDNEGAIQIAKHPISNSNSEHIDVRHHFLRELIGKKKVGIFQVASQYRHADFSHLGVTRGGVRISPG